LIRFNDAGHIADIEPPLKIFGESILRVFKPGPYTGLPEI
jgi:hypothetical protein